MSIIKVNIKELSVEQLKQLIPELEQLKVQVQKELVTKDTDFQTWLRYGEKKHYPSVFWDNGALQTFIKKRIDCERYKTIDIDRVLEKLEDERQYGDLSDEEYNAVLEDIRKKNFGSMTYDW